MKTNTHKDLDVCTHVLVHVDASRKPLLLQFEGAYEVLNRGDHFFRLDVDGRPKNVSVSRLK